MTRTGRAGFALPAALWIVVLVGAVSAGFLAAARAERRAVANAVASTRARWAARGGMALTLSTLDGTLLRGQGAARELRASGDTLHDSGRLDIGGVPVRSVLVDARARLNLDSASAQDLVGLQLALDVPLRRARRVAAAVLDWRDADDRPRPGGGEAGAYRSGELAARPANRPFASVGELQRVLGVDRELHGRLSPHLTVSSDGRVNVNAAPTEVLSLLPGLDPSAARLVVEARRRAPFRDAFQVLQALPAEDARALRESLQAFGRRTAFGPRRAELVVRATPDAPSPAAVVRGVLELEGARSWRILRVTGP